LQVLNTKYNCSIEEVKQIKEQHNEKKLRIEELEKIARMLTNDKTKIDNEIKQLKTENQILQEKIIETPPPPTTTPPRK
jgi:DNA-binding transcriptional MerR regulator